MEYWMQVVWIVVANVIVFVGGMFAGMWLTRLRFWGKIYTVEGECLECRYDDSMGHDANCPVGRLGL